MAAIALPTCPVPNEAEPYLRDFGGILTPFLGGPEQRINRLGTRLGLRVTMPELDVDEARVLASRLMRGKQEGAIMPWPLFDFDPGTPPNPQINASSTGTAISIKGLGGGYVVREGQPLSVFHGGHWYMHLATGDVTANSGGVASVGIFPPTRTAYDANDTVAIVAPMIEGLISPGDEMSWQIALDNSWSIPFSIVERR